MAVNPKASYHLGPNLDISPPDEGHLDLGSLLYNLDDGVDYPINDEPVPIPEARISPKTEDRWHKKEGVKTTLRDLRSTNNLSVWAKIFGQNGPGLALKWLWEKSDHAVLTVGEVWTRTFVPTRAYIEASVAAEEVQTHLGLQPKRQKPPIYMVTGIKVAHEVSLSSTRSRARTLEGDASATESQMSTSTGFRAAFKRETAAEDSFDGSDDFILGIRVCKIWWDGETTKVENKVAGGVLGDKEKASACLDGLLFHDDYVPDSSGEEAVVADDNATDGEPAVWILPPLDIGSDTRWGSRGVPD
jgi:hypothetical protein